MSEKGLRWLRTRGPDGNEHVVYLPELHRHYLSASCTCRPDVEQYAVKVITHRMLTGACAPQSMRERNH